MDDTAGRPHEIKHELACQRISTPLVSVIIVNYNYGRFLRETVDSVFDQGYPNIECIIVDNGSTDESAAVLQSISGDYPETKIFLRNENGGQSLASMEGFETSSGEYIVFLDADDILLPAFIETHIFVHLSLRIPVGFTSSDMFQAVGSRMVTGTVSYMSEFVRSGRGHRPLLLRRIDESAPQAWPLPSPAGPIDSQVHFVEPCDSGHWMWAPTSGNCFRRDALQLFLNNKQLAALRSCTDAYLLRAVNVVTGSVVIDRPLGIYRLHGMNVFSKHPHLNGVVSYDRSGPSDHNQTGRKLIMDHLVANAQFFVPKMPSPGHYINALKALDESWPRLPSSVPGCRTYLAGKVVTEASALSSALGHFYFILLLKRVKAAPHVVIKAWVKAWFNRKRTKPS